jgi:hypothetical protein
MELDLQTLGITKEDLTERLVERMADQLMREQVHDYGGSPEYCEDDAPTPFAEDIHKLLVARIDDKVEEIATTRVLPRIDEMIDNLTLQATNEWGEKKGETKTFTEYLVHMAEEYLQQPVDYEGTPCSRYGRNEQTRLVHLVNERLRRQVETAMENAVTIVKKSLSDAITETCKLQLAKITERLSVSVNVPR